MTDIKKRYLALIEKINFYDKQYYQEDNSNISDAAYDKLRLELEALERDHPEIITANSPTQQVGYMVQDSFRKVTHSTRMLSLANGFSKADIIDFIKRIQKFLNLADFPQICVEPKIDGISFVARFEQGRFVTGITRGDGNIGEDITENIKVIKDFPLELTGEYPDSFELRGEIYMTKDNFTLLNQKQQEAGAKIFSNPRNAASGSLRQLDTSITASRHLNYFIYTVITDRAFAAGQYDALQYISKFGFIINPYTALANSISDIMALYNEIGESRYNLPYDIDGMVYKVNDFNLQERLSDVARSPRWAIAHKFPAETAKTKLEDIIIQVGRTGAITPVACLTPVNIGGVVVTRASLHNSDEIERKDIQIGDIVTLQRAGDVIPQITAVDLAKRANVTKFIFPQRCPICDSKIERNDSEVVSRCSGEFICKAQIIGRLQHFVSKAAFDITHLGEKQIEFLYERGFITNILDIFSLEERQSSSALKLENLPRFGKKSVEKLYESIREKRIISLDKFIYSLSIRYIGVNNALLLAKNYISIDKFLTEVSLALSNQSSNSYHNLVNIDGIGVKVAQSLLAYFSYEKNMSLVVDLVAKLQINDFVITSSDSILSQKNIVFTGSLENYTRQEAKSLAQRLGAQVQGSISRKTDYVIAGRDAGSKLKKAEEFGIKILTEEQWKNLL